MIFGNLSRSNTIQARRDTSEYSQSWLASALYSTTVNTTMSSGLMFLVLSSPIISSSLDCSKEDAGIRKVAPNWEIPDLPKQSLCDLSRRCTYQRHEQMRKSMKRMYVLITYNLKIYTDQTNNSLIQKEKNQCPRE